MNKAIIATLIIVAAASLFGCPDDEHDDVMRQLGELRSELNQRGIDAQEASKRESELVRKVDIANFENKRLEDKLEDEKDKRFQIQIDSLKRKTIGLVPDIVWQLCLSLILIAITGVTIMALFNFFRGGTGAGKTIIYVTDTRMIIGEHFESIDHAQFKKIGRMQ